MTYEPKEREILDQVVAGLHGHYGERLSRVVLFGSRAEHRSAKVVSDFSRPNRRVEKQGTLRENLAASLSEPRSGGICLRLSYGSAAVTKTRSGNYRCARPRRNLALRAVRDGGKNAAAPWLVTLANRFAISNQP